MADQRNIRRFRTNPVEIAIFSIVTLVFCNSVYNLFYDKQGFHPTMLAPMASNPTTESRTPASVNKFPTTVDVTCDTNQLKDADTEKVRLNGMLCGAPKIASTVGAETSNLARTSIVNTANKFKATVFAFEKEKTFSTDYIPLNSGPNPIHIEFEFKGKPPVSFDVTINKK